MKRREVKDLLRFRAEDFFNETMYDWCERHLPDRAVDRIYDVVDPVSHWLLNRSCKLLGHLPTIDQCMIPEHDYCIFCGKLMPGLATERGWKHV